MTPNRAPLEELPEITRRILAVSKPEKIILFGSHARGDARDDSDLDLLVVLEGVEKPRAESVRLLRALRGLAVPVDILVTTPQRLERYRHTNGLVYQSALLEGKVIYERPTAP
ncbi:MAG: nucleotidyltransferase domain-containing protein [Anaerolineae bacterium]|nr:nucleotidyltransferase domain-containing protein [Anaerolineae bacterium]